MKESEIQSIIIDYLQILENQGKLFFQRVNNIPVFDKNRYRALPKGTKKGFPDIIILIQGRCLGIEIKTISGKQSEYQKEIESSFNQNGAYYYIVRSLEEMRKIIEIQHDVDI